MRWHRYSVEVAQVQDHIDVEQVLQVVYISVCVYIFPARPSVKKRIFLKRALRPVLGG